MASGCIIGNCPVCGELIWEDEWFIFRDILMHQECQQEYIKLRYGMNEEQFQRLCGSQELRNDIQSLKEIEEERHSGIMEMLEEMENRLNQIETRRQQNEV